MEYFLDCELATLDDMYSRKSTSKSDRDRHYEIALRMMEVALAHGIGIETKTRMKKILELSGRTDGKFELLDLRIGMTKYVKWLQGI